MRIRLDDSVVDAISVDPDSAPPDGSRSVGRLTGPDEARPLMMSLDAIGWAKLSYMTTGVRRRQGVDWDDVGYNYPNDISEPDEEPFDGVEVHNPIFETVVTEAAFDRLMARFFRAIVVGVQKHGDPVAGEPWWPEFVAATEEIERRVLAQPPPAR